MTGAQPQKRPAAPSISEVLEERPEHPRLARIWDADRAAKQPTRKKKKKRKK